jgi:alanine racemase
MPELESEFRTWAEVSRGALRSNVDAIRARIHSKGGVMAVVKADAYGHGIENVVKAVGEKVDWFGVANLQEALLVRRASGCDFKPVLILGSALPSERRAIAEAGFCPVVSSLEEASAYHLLAGNLGLDAVGVHLAVDTGMGRMGVWEREAEDTARAILGLDRLRLTGIATHFPSADEDREYTWGQIERFAALVTRLRAAGWSGLVHLANSAGILGFPESCEDLARVGLAIYGCPPIEGQNQILGVTLTWKTRVVLVRDLGAERSISYGRTFITEAPMRVATLAVGYADGYPRSLSGSAARVLIRGVGCPLLGRVTMDQIMVDVSACPEVDSGEEVVLLGRQGAQQITVNEMAKWAGTIPWEIFTGFGGRVVRVVVD